MHFGLGWQLIPVLFVWGVNRKVSRWRTFVVEPGVRQGGAVAFFVSPELLFTERVAVLSVSVGFSYQRVGVTDGVAFVHYADFSEFVHEGCGLYPMAPQKDDTDQAQRITFGLIETSSIDASRTQTAPPTPTAVQGPHDQRA